MKRHKQRGVALLVVLILLVMMSALAAKISQQFCRSLQKTHYQVSQQQLRWAMLSQQKEIEALLQHHARAQDKGLSPDGEWHQPLETEAEHYTVTAQTEDAESCFNVNTLLTVEPAPVDPADGSLPEKPVKEQIVEQLLSDSGLSSASAEEVYQQLVDYIDADSTTAKGGNENDVWANTTPAQQPANQMMRTISEIRLLPAFPAALYPKVSQLLCALPDPETKIDINTLKPEQAPLLGAVLMGTLSTDDAAHLLASRPEEGWASFEDFTKELETNYPQTKALLPQLQEFIAVNSSYFQVNSIGNTDDLTLRMVTQLHIDNEAGEIVTWQRRYRMSE